MLNFNFSKARLKEGDVLPEIILKDQDKKTVNTLSFKNKWHVLYFYPKDHTRSCTVQAQKYSQLSNEFSKNNIIVYGINTQKPENHADFIEKHSLNLKLLSDPEAKLAKLLGVKVFFGLCMRDTIIIDPSGKIKNIFRFVNAKSDPEVMLKYIIDLKNKN